MKSTENSLKYILITTLILSLSWSCVEESGREGLPSVTDFTKDGATGSTGCGEEFFIYSTGDTCTTGCEEGTHLATEEELAALISESSQEIQDIINNSAGTCVNDVNNIVRPTGQVFIESDFCACKDGKPDVVNNCTSFCATKDDTQSTLYVNVSLGADIVLNEELKTLQNWCTKEIGDGLVQPNCFLNLSDGTTTSQYPVTINGKEFSAVIESVPYGKTLLATLVESGSGSNASSKTFQLRKHKDTSDDADPLGILKIMAVTQYTCLTRGGSIIDGDNYYNNASRLHYYYPTNNAPGVVPPNNPFINCHDLSKGTEDNPLYPRLEAIPHHISMWDTTDVRMADLDQDGTPDVNELIKTTLLNDYDEIRTSVNLFGLFSWPNAPSVVTTEASGLGIYMTPWSNSQTGEVFCPTQTDYNSDTNIFKVLKEIVGVDTEGIYAAERSEVDLLTNDDGTSEPAPQDVILIREGLLKNIWFYFENGQHIVPTDTTAGQKTIMFYWPADVNDPYIKKSTQRIYTVRALDQIGQSGSTGLPTSIQAPDKRFGCIPKLD